MKKLISLVLVFLFLFGMSSAIKAIAAAAAINPPAKGSVAISTREQLEAIKNNLKGTYHLVNSIDLSGSEWVPIDGFRGTLDGQGYSINNLYITESMKETRELHIVSVGLFGEIEQGSVTIINLGVNIGSQGVYGYHDAGGLIGSYSSKGKTTLKIENCYVTGNISARTSAGGLIGFYNGDETTKGNSTLDINNCFTTGNISNEISESNALCAAGGLVGSIAANSGSARITNCYTTGNISASNTNPNPGSAFVGGLVGFVTFDQRVSITNCYATGDIFRSGDSYVEPGTSDHQAGELGGYDSVVRYKNCFYPTTQTVTGAKQDNYNWIDGEGQISKKALTPEEMRTESSFVGWNFKTIWGFESGKNDEYPVLLIFQSFSDIPASPALPASQSGSATPSPSPAPSQTVATAPSSWAEAQVNQAIEAKLVPQSLQSNYTQPITRAEFCALAIALYEKVLRRQIITRKKFDDTNDINVEKAEAIGLVTGTDGNNFSPHVQLTREQAATLLSRLALAMKKSLKKQTITFADKDSISTWSIEAVGQVQAAGIMSDTGDNKFSPKAPFTREQSIATIIRMYDIMN